MLLKYVYTFFLALLLVLFVGVGISVFYPEPERPDYSERLSRPIPHDDLSEKERVELEKSQEEDRAFQKKQERFDKRWNTYSRNVSIIALAISILVLVVTLTIFRHVPVISDGLLLGGVFILGYSIIRGFAGNDDIFQFFVISVGLIITLVLGYLKFIKDEEPAGTAS